MNETAWFLDFALKPAAVAALALLAARLLRHRSAAERSSVLHGGLFAMALLPLLMWLAPRWQVELPALPTPAPAAQEATSADTAAVALEEAVRGTRAARIERIARVTRSARSLGAPDKSASLETPPAPALQASTVIGLLYALSALALLMALAMSMARLRALRNRARPVRDADWDAALQAAKRRTGVRGQVWLLHSGDVASPLSFGLLERVIVIDDAAAGAPFDRETAEALLAHELAHLARYDWVKLVFARLVTALFWFNPLAWRLARHCHQLREEAADDAVLRGDIAGVDYAALLLRFARNRSAGPALAAHAISGREAMAHLQRRMVRVLDEGERRAPAMRAWSFGCAAAATLLALPVAAFAPAFTAPRAALAAEVPAAARTEPASGQRAAYLPTALTAAADAAPGELGFTIEPRRRTEPGIVQFTINEERERGRSTNSGPIQLAELQGLDGVTLAAEQPQSLRFRIVRDAGTLACEGVGQRQRATGTCRFEPDAGFVRELERRGLGRPTARQHLHLALQEASLATLDELARQGYEAPDIDRFVEMSIHGVDTEWLRGLERVGFRVENTRQLVEFRIHDVDAAYIGELQAAGFGNLKPKQLLEFRIHDVTPESVADLAEAGLVDLTPKQLVALHIHDVDAQFVRDMKTLGYGDLDAERLIEFSIHDVTRAYVDELRTLGYADLPAKRLVAFRIHDVTPAFVRDLAALGYRNVPADDLVAMKIHDVSPGFIREVADLGYRNVPVDELVAMQIHDVSPRWIRTQLAQGAQRPSIDDLVDRRIQGD